MSFFFSTAGGHGYGFSGTWTTAPPPPPKPIEIRFEHDGTTHRVLVMPHQLAEMLRVSAIYEQQLAGQRADQADERTPFTVTDALDVIYRIADFGHTPSVISEQQLRVMVRRAKRKAHPDTGGNAADFRLVIAAEEMLRTARRI